MKAIVDSSGKLVQTIYGNIESIALNTPQGCIAVDVPDGDNMIYNHIDGCWEDIPERASIFAVFDYSSRTWIDLRSVDEAKAHKWSEVKLARDFADELPFIYGTHEIDADSKSRVRITCAAAAGLDIDWTLATNDVVRFTALDMGEINSALVLRSAALHACSQTIRQSIDECSCIEDVNDIQITF